MVRDESKETKKRSFIFGKISMTKKKKKYAEIKNKEKEIKEEIQEQIIRR